MKNKCKIILTLLFRVVFSLSILSAQQIDPSWDIISVYEFNGNASDLSGNGNHGVLHGPVLTHDRNGNPNSAYFFDGVDDYIEINPVSDVSQIGDFTLSLWVNNYGWEIQPDIVPNIIDQPYIFDGHSRSSTVMSNFYGEGFHCNYKLKTGYNEFIVNTTLDFNTTSFINELNTGLEIINNWHHIVFIRKGDKTYHYINGELFDIRVNNYSKMDMQHNWYIGTFSGNNPYYNDLNYNFYGVIDDIYIYKRAINECEIEALYKGVFAPER